MLGASSRSPPWVTGPQAFGPSFGCLQGHELGVRSKVELPEYTQTSTSWNLDDAAISFDPCHGTGPHLIYWYPFTVKYLKEKCNLQGNVDLSGHFNKPSDWIYQQEENRESPYWCLPHVLSSSMTPFSTSLIFLARKPCATWPTGWRWLLTKMNPHHTLPGSLPRMLPRGVRSWALLLYTSNCGPQEEIGPSSTDPGPSELSEPLPARGWNWVNWGCHPSPSDSIHRKGVTMVTTCEQDSVDYCLLINGHRVKKKKMKAI